MAPNGTNKPGFHGIHDVGFTGLDELDATKLDTSTKQLAFWEKRTHATVFGLVKRRLMVVDELRRAIEALPPATYEAMTYYERWAAGASAVCMERGTFTRAEFDQELGVLPDPAKADEPKYARFKAGDLVRVKDEQAAVLTRWRKPHLRTPGYLFGLVGTVERECQGVFGNPEALAFHESAPVTAMYRVRFAQRDVWEGYTDEHEKDTVDVEIYDAWLEPATPQDLEEQRVQSAKRRAIFTAHSAADCTPGGHAHTHAHDHDHDHDHEHGHDHEHEDHVHEEREQVEQAAVDKEGDEQERCRISDALTRVLVAKGILTNEELRANVEALDMLGEKANGARLVAHAWADPEFRKRLLTDAHAACDELGIAATAYPTKPADPNAQVPDVSSGPPPLTERHGTVLTVLENTDSVHNLIVCTLCSCYPVSVLGISPSWYKSRQYRALAIRKPRDVLRAFGTELPPGLQVAVHDSTADNRYMVLPQRPAGTEGWTEEQLQAIITRDMLIGVARPATPAVLPA